MADDVAAAVAADLIAEDQADAAPEGEQAAPEQPDAPAAPQEEEFSYDTDTEGIEDLLAEPDDDEFEVEDPDDDEPVLVQTDEYQDPEVAKLLARNQKLEKQLKYQAGLRAQDNEKKWRGEAERRFPLADVDEIHATSRRAFLKQAHEQDARYRRKLEPVLAKLDTLRTEVIADAKAEGRAAAEQAYGKPSAAPQVAAVASAEETVDPRKFKTLHDLTLARLRAGQNVGVNDLVNQ